MRDLALQKAIDVIGGVSETSRALGLTPSAVSQWERVPGERVLELEKATGGKVTRYELRPDLYPRDDK